MKKITSIFLTLTILVSSVVVPVKTAFAAGSYNVDAALEYARNHWNDGKGLCAEFVSDCLTAGGINVNIKTTRTLRNYLVDNGYAIDYYITSKQGTRIKMADYAGKIAVGDVIINYCEQCDVYPHVMFVSGTNSSGQVTYYAHNSAANNKAYWNGSDGYKSHGNGSHTFQMHVLHMRNSVHGGVTQPQPVHTHSYVTQTDSAHPHYRYNVCSCGTRESLGASTNTSCAQCYPLGNVTLKRSFDKTKGTVEFYRNTPNNAHNYTLELYYKESENGSYSLKSTYDMASGSKTITGLSTGYYYGKLVVKNAFTGETRYGTSESFRIVDSYTIKYNANGGANAPGDDAKIEGVAKTLTSAIPTRDHYVFRGWARSKNATTAEYAAGGLYQRDANVTLYAVWEPETYTIKFDANGGKGELENFTITYGNTIKMPNTIIKDGYYLKGWSTNKATSTPEYKLGIDHKPTANMTLYAIWGQSTWSGAVSSRLDGEGTAENPYKISSAADLAYLANKVNNQTKDPAYEYYELTDNINLAYTEWVPIGLYGTEHQYFYGSLDGNGYTISDMYITQANEGYIGLFGYSRGSVIKNISLTGAIENVSFNGYAMLGGIVGNSRYSLLENVSSKNINIAGITNQGDEWTSIGTVVGRCEGEKLVKCSSVDCYISVGKSEGSIYAGMIVGRASTLERCSVVSTDGGLISVPYGTPYVVVGGVAGEAYNMIECIVDAPYLSNNIKTTCYVYIGGLAGDCESAKRCSVRFYETEMDSINATTDGCTSSDGGTNIRAGGLFGQIEEIQDCKYDGGSIVAKTLHGDTDSESIAGGISGWMHDGERAFANIDGRVGAISSLGEVMSGGIAGYVYKSGGSGTVKNIIVMTDTIYGSGRTTKTGYVFGENNGATIDNVYYNSEMTISPSTGINTSGTPRAEKTINGTFLTNVLGLTPYVSMANLEGDTVAVWVYKDGELPELYYNCLNDITVSNDIENGTVEIDREQAVDGEVVTVTATPADGYVLNKIYKNGEEINGTTFEVLGNCEVYATFAEVIPEYEVSLTTDENATGTLVNVDSTEPMLMTAMLLTTDEDTSITANDGEQIQVNTIANEDYTVDTIYVNGEEIAGNSFIIENNSVVTMDVTSISTEYSATTNDAENVGVYSATLSGRVEDFEEATKYIQYWITDEPETVYTTNVETGSGEYSVNVTGLESNTEYSFRMTEKGEVKTFTTLADVESAEEFEGEEDSTVSVTGVLLNKPTVVLNVGETAILTVTVIPTDATNKDVTWKSSNTSVATVLNGVVTAISAGTATITATTEDGGYTATCTVTVNELIDKDEPCVSVEGVSGRAGNTVDVKINLSNNPGVVFAKFNVTFGEELTLTNVVDGGLLGNANHSNNKVSPYILYWNNGTAESDFTGNGTIATLTFKIAEDVEDGVYPVTIQEVSSSTFNFEDETVYFAVKNGNVTVVSKIIGDVNGDGEITARDERDLSRHIAGWIGYEEIDIFTADVNGDGEITARDERDLSRYIAGWVGYETLPKSN